MLTENQKLACQKYYAKHREERNAKHREWYYKHYAHIAEYSREYYRKHQEIMRAKTRRYKLEHPEKVKAALKKWRLNKAAEWYRKNAAKCYAATVKWRKANPEAVRAAVHRRRLRKNRGVIENSKYIIAWEKIWRRKKYATCFWCRNKIKTSDCHSDHIVPLSKNGTHTVENLCISCAACNVRKSAKSLSKWNKELSQPVLL